jgi:hypothetical protein
VQGYVGQTTNPRARLLQHRRVQPSGVAAAMRADSISINDLLYVPLEIVPAEHKDDFETRWTIRANAAGTRSLNAFGTIGNPARSRGFWQGRHARAIRSRHDHRHAVDGNRSVIDLT